jgi:CubicO group peptidase (beta-lactamase class C family)
MQLMQSRFRRFRGFQHYSEIFRRNCRAFGVGTLILTLPFLAFQSAHANGRAHRAHHDDYPGQHWIVVSKPEDRGWSSEKLGVAKAYADSIDTAAVMIIDDGVVVSHWGEIEKAFKVHSIRKSFLSALYGTAVARREIDLYASLEKLGVDDNEPSLTPVEKQARVIDLLKARSGIYHAALYESPAMKAEKPTRGSHPPRSFWSYNNWDFNALGTIYESATRDSVYHSFDQRIAQPIGMEDYRYRDQEYVTGPESIHRAYTFRMTARDMARFGLLYLRDGKWRGRQLIPSAWVRESTTAYSVADGNARDGYSGYGYLWWVAVNGNHYPKADVPDGSFSAWGSGGHFIAVIPALQLVVVHRVNTDEPERKVTLEQFGELLRLILAAKKS